MNFSFQLIYDSLPRIMGGAVLTVELTVVSLALGLCLALPLALMRASRHPLLWMPVYGYIYFMRGTPLLVQVFIIYYGSGQFEWLKSTPLWPAIFRDPYWPTIIAFTLNTAAYTAEIFRGAIQAVPHGEVEAAKALGMSRGLLLRRIILPTALRYALPAYGNEVILMLQATSLASVVTLLDLTGVARVISARSLGIFEMFLTIGAIYLALTYLISWGFNRIEYALSGHLRDRPDNKAKLAVPVLR